MFLSAGETKKEVKEEVSKMTDELSSKMESAKLEDKVKTKQIKIQQAIGSSYKNHWVA